MTSAVYGGWPEGGTDCTSETLTRGLGVWGVHESENLANVIAQRRMVAYLCFTDAPTLLEGIRCTIAAAPLELVRLLLVLDDLDAVPQPQSVAAVDGAEHEAHRRPSQDSTEYAALPRHRNLRRVPLDLALFAAEGQYRPDRGEDLLCDGSCSIGLVSGNKPGTILQSELGERHFLFIFHPDNPTSTALIGPHSFPTLASASIWTRKVQLN